MSPESSAPIRLWARGPSGTLTASTPAALSARTWANIGAGSTPRGRHDLDGGDELPGGQLGAESGALAERHGGDARRGGMHRRDGRERAVGDALCTKPTIALMCSGVVPQQPPTNSRPASTMRLAYSPCTPATPCRSCDPPTSRGSPAFGWPRAGGSPPWRAARSPRARRAGPTEQLTPMTSTPIASSAGPKSDGAVP